MRAAEPRPLRSHKFDSDGMLIECIATKHFDSSKKMSSEGKNADGAASVNYPSTWDRFANLDRYSFRSQQISGHHPFSRIEWLSLLLLFLIAGLPGWIAVLCIVEANLAALQIISSLYGASVNWFALLLIVNGRLIVTTQQIFVFWIYNCDGVVVGVVVSHHC